jgi:thiazole synthase ThiGH ThiG subunit
VFALRMQLMQTAAGSQQSCCSAALRNSELAVLTLLYQRCNMLLQADPDDLLEMLNSAFALYVAQGKHCQAVRVALRMDDMAKIEQLYTECSDEGVQKQMAYILARYVFLELCLCW